MNAAARLGEIDHLNLEAIERIAKHAPNLGLDAAGSLRMAVVMTLCLNGASREQAFALADGIAPKPRTTVEVTLTDSTSNE